MSGLAKRMIGHLPDGWRHRLKKWYYPGRLVRFDESAWEYAPLMKKWITPGDSVIDAGANIGYLSRLLAGWVGPEGTVFSFEPVPLTYDLLQHNVKRLQLDNVQAIHAGLSEKPGKGQIQVPQYEDGGDNLYESRLTHKLDPEGGKSFEVNLESLDHFFADHPSDISVIKIDVEGHEASVIKGGLQLLEQHRPALLIEVEGRLHEVSTPAGRMYNTLLELGYSPFIWHEQRLIPWEAPATAIDFLFLQPAHVEQAE